MKFCVNGWVASSFFINQFIKKYDKSSYLAGEGHLWGKTVVLHFLAWKGREVPNFPTGVPISISIIFTECRIIILIWINKSRSL